MLFILSIEGGLGPRILANALNKQIDEILKKFPMINIQYEDVKLRPQSIERWFAYKENQQSK